MDPTSVIQIHVKRGGSVAVVAGLVAARFKDRPDVKVETVGEGVVVTTQLPAGNTPEDAAAAVYDVVRGVRQDLASDPMDQGWKNIRIRADGEGPPR